MIGTVYLDNFVNNQWLLSHKQVDNTNIPLLLTAQWSSPRQNTFTVNCPLIFPHTFIINWPVIFPHTFIVNCLLIFSHTTYLYCRLTIDLSPTGSRRHWRGSCMPRWRDPDCTPLSHPPGVAPWAGTGTVTSTAWPSHWPDTQFYCGLAVDWSSCWGYTKAPGLSVSIKKSTIVYTKYTIAPAFHWPTEYLINTKLN
jgi:hypothetical protein